MEVLINLNGKIMSEDGLDTTQASVLGTFRGDPSDYTLSYKENFDENDPCSTVLHVRNGRSVDIIRRGSFNSELTVEKQKRHNCSYSTPFGDFMVGIYGRDIDSRVEKNSGSLHMRYTIDFFGGLASETEMSIDFSGTQKKKVKKDD